MAGLIFQGRVEQAQERDARPKTAGRRVDFNN